MQRTARDHQWNCPSIRELQEVGATLLSNRLGDAQSLPRESKVVPFFGGGQERAYIVQGEVAHRKN
jgi:hypothetical protein